MKRIIAFLMCFLTLFLSGCTSLSATLYCPTSKPNTKWISGDGKIWFYVDEKGEIKDGIFIKDGAEENVNIRIADFSARFFMGPLDADEDEIYNGDYFCGVAYFKKYSMKVGVLVSTVDEYEKGDTIIFARFDEW